jgi:hypothetical protein
MNPAILAVLRRRKALRRRIHRARRYAVPVAGAQVDRWRAAAFGDHVCYPFTVTLQPGGRVLVVDTAPVHSPRFGEHVCPRCGVERADFEGPGAHLENCPNCGAADDPVPADDLRRERLGEIAAELTRRAAEDPS